MLSATPCLPQWSGAQITSAAIVGRGLQAGYSLQRQPRDDACPPRTTLQTTEAPGSVRRLAAGRASDSNRPGQAKECAEQCAAEIAERAPRARASILRYAARPPLPGSRHGRPSHRSATRPSTHTHPHTHMLLAPHQLLSPPPGPARPGLGGAPPVGGLALPASIQPRQARPPPLPRVTFDARHARHASLTPAESRVMQQAPCPPARRLRLRLARHCLARHCLPACLPA